jgi:hypothetical protein
MRLSPNFTYKEMTESMTADKHGIRNVPGERQLVNLRLLCNFVLEPVRTLLGVPVIVTSGYRCLALNRLVGGARTSQHQKGEAADFVLRTIKLQDAFIKIVESDIPFDQIIFEFGDWIHISYSAKPRRQALIATRVNGKVKYSLFNKKLWNK